MTSSHNVVCNSDLTIKKLRQVISRYAPAQPLDLIEYLAEGDYCCAYLVNGELIVRVAKHAEARRSLRREYFLLPRLQDRLPLAIPNPQLAALDDDLDYPFVAHSFLPGTSLSRARFLELDDATQTQCATQLGVFLRELHSSGLDLAQGCDLPVTNYSDRYLGTLTNARNKLFPFLDQPEQRFVEQLIQDYLDSGYASTYRATLLHGDLSSAHILFSEAAGSVSGIIDFGDVMIGDPAWDFVFLYDDYGVDFLSRSLNTYGDQNRAALLRRMLSLSMLDAVCWAAGPRSEVELRKAVAHLQTIRIQEKERRQELFDACRVK
jgi:aminoglycoside 2''-phosphotransferase